MKKIYFLLLAFSVGFNLNAQIVNIPDVNFKTRLLESSTSTLIAINLSGGYFKIDANNDGQIQVSEASQVSILNVSNAQIADLTGILSFTNIQTLNCFNNQLSSLNVSGLTQLQNLNCATNQLTSLNVSGLTNLFQLTCSNNQLNTINVSGLTNLQNFYCSNNQLSSLNVSGLSYLYSLDCGFNQLSSLTISGLTNLQYLYSDNNNLTSLNLSGLTNINTLSCKNNQLANLNVIGITNLRNLDCDNNQFTNLDLNGLVHLLNLNCTNNMLLTYLSVKNSLNEYINFHTNPSLRYICADEGQINVLQNQITSYNYNNCHVNSYCSFTPGGNFYTLQGANKFDATNNACDPADIIYPNLKLSFSDGTNTGNLIPDATGNYHYDVQAGTHTITPLLENTTYFVVSPTSATVAFPSTTSPATQNFCISPNGVHNDLEIMIFPLTQAIPGFDAYYKIVYKNKGTHTQSGSVNLLFNDSILDFITSYPSAISQTINNLNWSFINLMPFESRGIVVVLNVNSQSETPPVNSGSLLSYTATINGVIDETPIDNIGNLNQISVNSLDPNDKKCLEGTTIPPAKVGDYVHYIIRFENNGTANAQNIVIKDMIDTSKFVVSSLIPLTGSHPFTTRITSTNKIEFIFENIQLPFDDANNDGYVVFKIKTKPTLVLGNTFSNTASIYFDYNFPIITNTYTTTVAALANQDFEFDTYFSLYPNPTKAVLNIKTKDTIEMSSISIYNVLGQLMMVIPNAKETTSIDVSSLTKGNYFIKIISDKGTSNAKFIKE